MIVRTLGAVTYGLLSLATVAALAIGWLAFQLRLGEVSLAAVEPYLHRLVDMPDAGVRIGFAAPALRLAPTTGELELVVRDLSVIRADGVILVEAPRAAIDPDIRGSVRALRPRLRAISIVAPELTLERDASGGYGLAMPGAKLRGVDPGPGGLVGMLQALLAEAPGGVGPDLLRLEEVHLTLLDRASGTSLRGEGGSLVIDRTRGEASIDLRFPDEHADTWISLTAKPAAAGAVRLDGSFSGLDLRRFRPWLALPDLLARPSLPWSGTVAGEVGGEHGGTLRLHATLRGQMLDLPELLPAPLPIDQLQLDVLIDPRTSRARIERLLVSSEAARLEGEGEVGPTGGHLAVHLTAVDRAKLLAIWPKGKAPRAQTWLRANLQQGRIDKGDVTLTFGENGATIAGGFDFSSVALRYLEPMTPAQDLAGKARLGADGLDFTLERGRIGGLDLGSGRIELTQLAAPGGGRARIELGLRGPVAAALELSRQAPGKFLDALPSDLRRVRGTGRYDLEIALPLAQVTSWKEVGLTLKAQLADVTAPGLVAGRDLTGGDLTLSIDAERATLTGKASIEGLVLEPLTVVQPFATDASAKLEITARTRATPEQLVALGLPAVEGLAGPMVIALQLQVPKKGPLAGDLAVDLQATTFVRPDLLQAKRAGTAGQAKAGFTTDGQLLTLTDLQLDLPQLRARGRLELEAGTRQLRSLALSELSLAGSRLAVSLRANPEGGLMGRVSGRRFDLTPWISSERPSSAPAPALDLLVDVEELALGEGRFRDLRGRLQRDARSWQQIGLEAGTAKAGQIRLDLTPGPENRQLRIRTDDAGAVLEAIDPTADFASGGTFELAGELLGESPIYRLTGTIEAKGFRVDRAPFLARLLSLASISGLAGQLQGTGIAIDQAKVGFTLAGNKVDLVQGRLTGSGLGLTLAGKVDLGQGTVALSGTLVPLYGLNRLLGQIPLLGWILRGGEGLGAFAATYTASGPLREPEISVNPLSFVVPGMLRDLIDVLPIEPTPPSTPAPRD